MKGSDGRPTENHIIVKYDDLVSAPEKTVREIYGRFGFDIGPDFERVLQEESARALRYSSRHDYSPEENGLSRQQILDAYRDIFERFGFDTTRSLAQPLILPGRNLFSPNEIIMLTAALLDTKCTLPYAPSPRTDPFGQDGASKDFEKTCSDHPTRGGKS